MNAARLNGWQRVFVVVAAIYLIPVLFYLWITIGELEHKYANSRYFDTMNRLREQVDANFNTYVYYKLKDDDDFYKRVQDKFPTISFSDIEMSYQHQKKNHLSNVLAELFIGLVVWVGPLSVLYTFGYSVGWIASGFKNKN